MVELNKTQIAISVKSWKAPDKESDIYHNFLSKRTQMSNSLRAAEGLVHGGASKQHSAYESANSGSDACAHFMARGRCSFPPVCPIRTGPAATMYNPFYQVFG
jgi:hypothetical protein